MTGPARHLQGSVIFSMEDWKGRYLYRLEGTLEFDCLRSNDSISYLVHTELMLLPINCCHARIAYTNCKAIPGYKQIH